MSMLVPMFKSWYQTQHKFKLCYWPLKVLGRWFCLFESGWNGSAYKVSHQTWGAAAAAEKCEFLCLLHTMIQILGRISRTRRLSAPPLRPFQLAFKKGAKLSNVLFNFLKNLKRWWCSHSWRSCGWVQLRRRPPDEK
jgi:hypothetical protein